MPPESKFWSWYERHYVFNLVLAAGLFVLQLIHLFWLTTHVVLHEITGVSHFNPSPFFQLLLIAVDYTEIPALITTSLIYVNVLRKQFRWKAVLYLVFLNSQWLHLFWITDEFVIERLFGDPRGTVLPYWLAWVAIGIDYLELPVIVDTVRRVIVVLQKDGWRQMFKKTSRYYVWRH